MSTNRWSHLIIAVVAAFCGRIGSAQENILLDFEDVPAGSRFFHPLHPAGGGPGTFQTAGVTVYLADYYSAVCTTAPDTRTCAAQCASTCPWREGIARVEPTGIVGAGGNEILLSSVNLELVFARAEVIELRYAELGGDVNIEVNGGFRNARDMLDLDQQIVGGYRIAVGPDVVILTPDTEPFVTSFAIGGQELILDDVILENASVAPPSSGYLFIRGDSNADLQMNISDGAHILNYLFLGMPPALDCDDAGDVNDDGLLNISDPIRLFGYLFAGDPSPPPPNDECGPDPTPDGLGCGFHPACPPESPSTVPLETLVGIAARYVHIVWEGEAAPGEPVAVSDLAGREFAFMIPFVRGRRTFPEREEILAVVRELKAKHGPFAEEGPEALPPAFFAELEEVLGEMSSVEVSATLENFPVLAVRSSLHPYFLYRESAQSRAAALLRTDDVRLERILLIGPHEEYCEFAGDRRSVLIHVYTFQTRTLGELAELATYVVPPQLFAAKERAWEEVLSGRLGSTSYAVKRIDEWKLVPVVDWTWWCVPTAATMVACFWDNHVAAEGTKMGYGRIVDYWFEHSSGHNVPNVLDEIIDPATGTWSAQGYLGSLNTTNGYQFSKQDVSGSPANDWAWNDIKAEIDADRPAMWAASPPNPKHSGHAMTVFGSRVVGSQKSVIVYNTWGSTAAAQYAEYNYDQWGGGQSSGTGVLKLTPGGGTGSDHAVLLAPDGGEVLSGASEIRWYVWGSAITRTDLYHSTDGGRTWASIATVPIGFDGPHSFSWTPAATTSKGRVRNRVLRRGRPSDRRLFVAQKADLVAGGPPSYCRYNAQGQLIVKVENKGNVAAPASTTRVGFHGINVSLPTPAIPAGGWVEVYADIPSPCWQPDCSFTITVDFGNVVGEANENNNVANGVCFA